MKILPIIPGITADGLPTLFVMPVLRGSESYIGSEMEIPDDTEFGICEGYTSSEGITMLVIGARRYRYCGRINHTHSLCSECEHYKKIGDNTIVR